MALTDAVRRRLRPGTTALDQDFLGEQADMIDDRVARYRLFEDYYQGEQRTRLMARALLYLQASGLCFAENFCETVVDTLANRLKIEAFHHEKQDALAEWLNGPFAKRNRLGELQTVVHSNTPMLGDGFVFVEFDEAAGIPRLRWNRPHNVKPTYDDETGELALVSKLWATTRISASNPDGKLIQRLNLYYPDRVEKYYALAAGKGSQWATHEDEEGDSGIAWLTTTGDQDGEPLGIPVVHFRNRARGRTFGRSDLRGAIPFQDELNKQLLDLFYVMDTQAWRTKWATGVSAESSLSVAPGNWVRTADKDARFGALDADDPSGMLESIDATLRRMSAKTGTPLFDLIKGTPPSGEALKTSEAGLIARGEDCQEGFGNSWTDAAAIATRQMLAFGEPDFGELPEDEVLDVSVMWEPVATRNERDETEMYVMQHDLGVSRRTILTKLGYDADAEEKQRAEEDAQDAPPAPPPPTDPPVPPPADPPAGPAPKPQQ